MDFDQVFDWSFYFAQLAEEIRWQKNGCAMRAAQLETAWPAFRNISYPLAATPLVVRQEWHLAHQEKVKHYLALLEKTIRLCVEHSEISDYLGHSEQERRFILTPLFTKRYITICRLDGYVDRHNGQLKVLEHNSDSPAGIVFSPRLNALVRTLWQELGELSFEDKLAKTQFDDPKMTQHLFGKFATANPELVILQEEGKSNSESQEMAKAFSATGLPTRVSDPRQLHLEGKKVTLENRVVNVIWNKINTVYWRRYIQDHPDQIEKWLTILHDGEVCHLNHFGARVVTENKRCLSLLQEARFAHLFSSEEDALVREILPWASKFELGKKVEWQNEILDIATLAQREQHRFVIKEPYDIRGDGVTVGYDCNATQWQQKITEALENGYVLQQYIAPLQMPIFHVDHWSPVRTCNLSFDTFVFDGEIAGYGAKASTLNRVNLFKGGQKLAVFIGA